jgi:peroxiredoxin
MELKRAFQSKALLPLAFLLLFSPLPAGAIEVNLTERAKAPEFALKDLDGNYVSIIALRGKVIVLNFWATWCPPCKDEMPSLNQLYGRYKDKGLVVLAVSLNKSKEAVKDFLETTPLDFTMLLDDGSKVTKQYKVYSIPATFVIDKGGFIVRKYQGPEEWVSPKIIKTIEELLK